MSKKWLATEGLTQRELERKAKERSRMISDARQFASADRTDPFTFHRAMTHIDNGVASFRRERGRDIVEVESGDAFYKATAYREPRSMTGHDGKPQTFYVMRYMNVARP